MLNKHISNFAVYTSNVGREQQQQHTLVEETDSLKEAQSLIALYQKPDVVVYIVDNQGTILYKK